MARLRERFTNTSPSRLLGPAFAAASVIVIIAVAIGQSGDIAGNDSGDSASSVQQAPAIQDQPGDTSASGTAEDSASSAGGAGAAGSGAAAGSGDYGSAGTPVAPGSPEAARDFQRQSAPKQAAAASGVERGTNLDNAQRNRKVERDAQL